MKINNNTLVMGLFLALIVSVAGTWISLNYINSLTGAATTGVGSTNLTVTSLTSCVVSDNKIDFGELTRGAVSQGIQNKSDNITVTNDGNANITVVVNASKNLWGTDPAPTTNWQIKCSAAEDGNATCNTTFTNIPAGNSNHTLVVGLSGQDEFDNVAFDVKVTVPNDEIAGAKNGTLLFWCYENSIPGA